MVPDSKMKKVISNLQVAVVPGSGGALLPENNEAVYKSLPWPAAVRLTRLRGRYLTIPPNQNPEILLLIKRSKKLSIYTFYLK